MNRILNFTMIQLTIFMVIGILLYDHLSLQPAHIFFLCVLLLGLIGFLMVVLKDRYKYHVWISLWQCLTFVAIGLLVSVSHDTSLRQDHYLNQISVESKSSRANAQFRIVETLRSNLYSDKYIIEIEYLNDHPSQGRLLLNVNHDRHCENLTLGNRYYWILELQNINKPLNPGSFDYSKYMTRQAVYAEADVSVKHLIQINKSTHILYSITDFRTTLQERLVALNFGQNENAVMNAILLGQKQELSTDLRSKFANAGAIHILAVSGLHIGIILLMLQRVFKPLNFIPYGRLIKITLIIVLLWNYAILAGLSASIVRATTMFSIVGIAMNLKRPTNIINTLFISIFVILLFRPGFIHEVGFQLSYLAVFGIVLIEPKIRLIWQPNNTIVKYLWQIITVSLAAQIGVLPLSLYYFHQFPGLFFLTNLVIIPCLGLILGLGFIVLFLITINEIPEILILIYQFILKTLNAFVEWIAGQDIFIIEEISFSKMDVLMSYAFIGCMLWIIEFKSYRSIVSVLTLIISFQIINIVDSFSTERKLIVFHKSRHTIIGHQLSDTLYVHHSMDLENVESVNPLVNYQIAENLYQSAHPISNDLLKFNDKYMLLIDSLGVYEVHGFKPSIVLLRSSPKINLNRLIDLLNPEIIIADGSNYRSYQDRWRITCETKKIPFHQTSEKGAFIYRY